MLGTRVRDTREPGFLHGAIGYSISLPSKRVDGPFGLADNDRLLHGKMVWILFATGFEGAL